MGFKPHNHQLQSPPMLYQLSYHSSRPVESKLSLLHVKGEKTELFGACKLANVGRGGEEKRWKGTDNQRKEKALGMY